MQRHVAIPHCSKYPNPISFRIGAVVTLGATDDEDPGWIRARLADGNEGWAPEAILERRTGASGLATATADYDAHELETVVGESLEVLRELNGWFWARNARGEEGWVPWKTTLEA